MNRSLAALAPVILAACGTPESGNPGSGTSESATIQPRLAFTISAEEGLTAARDLTVDPAGNIFVFDYDDYVIHKIDPDGVDLARFGGPEGEDAGFTHLMAIRAVGDSLLALDAGKHLAVDFFSVGLASQDQTAAGASQGFVSGGGDHITVGDGRRVHPGGNQSGDVGHIHHQQRIN